MEIERSNMAHVTINLMGIKVKEYDTDKASELNIIRFLKDMKKLEEETKGALTVRASVSIREE